MSIDIRLNLPKDDVNSNLIRLRIFKSELRIVRKKFYSRLRLIMKREDDFYKNSGIPKPVFSMKQLSDDFADVELNLYFKSFLFIYRQFIEKVFRIIFLLKPRYENKKAKIKIPDASRPGKFSKFIDNLLNNKYEYDNEILEILIKYSDLFILSRILRNTLKLQGTFNTLFINNKPIIVCPILAKDKKDKTLKLLKNKLSVELDKLKNLTMSPGILDDFIKSTEDLEKILIMKSKNLNTT